MNTNSPDHHSSADSVMRLERFIDAALRAQPPRRAPATLETRVLHALALTSQPWWRRGFMHWPLIARIAFLLMVSGAVRFTLGSAARAVAWLTQTLQHTSLSGLDFTWLKVMSSLHGTLLASVPTAWVYAGLAVVGLMYASLFGLGAAAYRTLYADR